MTHLTKPVRRETYAPKWGNLMVTMTAAGIEIREKGKRTTYGPVSWGTIMQKGAELKAAETRLARASKRNTSKRRNR